MRDRTSDMTIGNPAKLILQFSLPLMLGNVFQTMYTMVDSIIVGQGVGVNALAALGAGDWLSWMMISAITGVTQGFGILYAKYFGAKKEEKLCKSIADSIVLAIIITVVLTIIAQLSCMPILQLMKTDTQIIDISHSYLRIIFYGLTVVMAYNMSASILRSLGNGRDPLIAMVISSVLNIGLDLLFVMVFHWGVEGAAIATVIAQCCACTYCIYSLMKIKMIKLRNSHFNTENNDCIELLRLGLPLAFMNVIIAAGGLVVQSAVNTYGIAFVAGFTVTNKLYSLLEVAATSFGFAVATYVSQNHGAGKLKRIKEGMKASSIMAVITAIVISLLMLITGKSIISLFIDADATNKDEVIRIAYQYLSMMCYFLWVLYLLHIHRSALQGLSDTVTPLITSVAELIMRVSAVLLLPLFIGSEGIFFAEILAWTGSAIILIAVYQYRIHHIKEEQII